MTGMDHVWMITQQTLVMFLYMLVGFVLYRARIITQKGSKEIAGVLIKVVIPVVIANSFCVEFSMDRLKELGISALLGAAALLIAIVTARVIFRKSPIDDFAAAFSNAGFIGIPLVQATFGSEAVFFLVGIIAMLNLLQWTYGVMVLTGKKASVTPKSLFVNPILIGTAVGLVLFCTGLGGKLPAVLSTTVKGIAAMNSPLAMIVLGVYLAQTTPKALFTTGRLYVLCAVRLLLIPAITLGVFWLLPVDRSIAYAILVAAAAPVGANVAVYAQLHDLDYSYACQTVVLSTLFSIATVPLVLLAATAVM